MNIKQAFWGLILGWAAISPSLAANVDPTRPPAMPTMKATRPATQPGPISPAPMPTLALNSTILGGAYPVAIINGQPFKTGDTLQGLQVRGIGQGWARLEGAGIRLILRLPSIQFKPQWIQNNNQQHMLHEAS